MSRQRITTIGSVPLANSEATASRRIRSPSFSSRCTSTRWGPSSLPSFRQRERACDLLGGADEHVRELDGLLHRRLHAVQPERVSHLLRVVDDVIKRRRKPVPVAGVERRPDTAPGEAVDQVVRDPVPLLFARANLGCDGRIFGVVGEQLAQQQAGALNVATGLIEQLGHPVVCEPPEPRHRAETSGTGAPMPIAASSSHRLTANGACWGRRAVAAARGACAGTQRRAPPHRL